MLQSLFDTFAHQQSLWLWHLEHCVDKLIVDFFWCKALISIHRCIGALQCCTTTAAWRFKNSKILPIIAHFPELLLAEKAAKLARLPLDFTLAGHRCHHLLGRKCCAIPASRLIWNQDNGLFQDAAAWDILIFSYSWMYQIFLNTFLKMQLLEIFWYSHIPECIRYS